MTASALPFDDIRNLLAALPPSDEDAATRARSVFARAAARQGSLGKLVDVATWLAAWSGRFPPLVARPLVAVFAGTHGVAPPSPATADAVEFIASGGAVVSQARVAADLGLKGQLLYGGVNGDIWIDPALSPADRTRVRDEAIRRYRASPQVAAAFTHDEVAAV